jgi:hypothetical protein
MQKKLIAATITLGASLLVVRLIAVLSSHEPSYEGRQLNSWMDRLPARLLSTNGYSVFYPEHYTTLAEAQANQPRLLREENEARKAVKALGTQGLIVIVRRLNTKDDSRLRTTLIRWAFKLNLLHHSSRSGRSAEFTRGQALTALVELARSSLLEGVWLRKCLRIKDGLAKVCSQFPTLLSP